jgi:hypothetical protein
MSAVVVVSVDGLRRVRAHQQGRAVPLEARVTATWNVGSLGVVGGPKGLRDYECSTTRTPRSGSLVSSRPDRLEAPRATLLPSRPPAPYRDDVLVRMPVVQFLRDCGYRVVEATSTDEAMAIFQKTNFPVDVVLSEIDLPGSMNGFGFDPNEAQGPRVTLTFRPAAPERRSAA